MSSNQITIPLIALTPINPSPSAPSFSPSPSLTLAVFLSLPYFLLPLSPQANTFKLVGVSVFGRPCACVCIITLVLINQPITVFQNVPEGIWSRVRDLLKRLEKPRRLASLLFRPVISFDLVSRFPSFPCCGLYCSAVLNHPLLWFCAKKCGLFSRATLSKLCDKPVSRVYNNFVGRQSFLRCNIRPSFSLLSASNMVHKMPFLIVDYCSNN